MNTLKKVLMLLLIVAVVSLGLTGCKDTEKEEAIAEAAMAQTKLAEIKADLASMMSERENLKLELTTVTEARDKLQGMVEQAATVKGQLAELIEERDAAIAKVTDVQTLADQLKSQLAEQVKKFTELEGQNQKLQEMLEEMKTKLSGEIEVPSIPGL